MLDQCHTAGEGQTWFLYPALPEVKARIIRTYCIAQGTLLNTLASMGKESEKEGIYVYV